MHQPADNPKKPREKAVPQGTKGDRKGMRQEGGRCNLRRASTNEDEEGFALLIGGST